MVRTKNTASKEDLKKCLKGELNMLDPAKFNDCKRPFPLKR